MTYFVSRQHYYYTGEKVVEIAEGGLDNAGCDMLVSQYPGEGQEYTDPRDAVEAAIKIFIAWAADAIADRKSPNIVSGIAVGWGCIADLEPTLDLAELRTYAEAEYEGLEKCARCSELIEGIPWTACDYLSYCSERCARSAYDSATEHYYAMEEAQC